MKKHTETETRWAPAHPNPANVVEAAELRALADAIEAHPARDWRAIDPVTCQHPGCWRTWDAWLYPTPSDRCPWEYDHEHDEPEVEVEPPHTSETVVPIIASALRQRFGHPPLGDPWTWDEVVEDVLDIVAWALQENGVRDIVAWAIQENGAH